eukprot:gene24769-63083_t
MAEIAARLRALRAARGGGGPHAPDAPAAAAAGEGAYASLPPAQLCTVAHRLLRRPGAGAFFLPQRREYEHTLAEFDAVADPPTVAPAVGVAPDAAARRAAPHAAPDTLPIAMPAGALPYAGHSATWPRGGPPAAAAAGGGVGWAPATVPGPGGAPCGGEQL